MKELRKQALELYKETALESWIIGLLSGLLIAGLVALCFLSPILALLVVPFICMPLFFSMHSSHTFLHVDQRLTFTGTMRQFFLYFTRPFNSSFSFISSLFKSLLAFVATEAFISLFGIQITYLINPGINDSIQAFQNYLTELSDFSIEEFDYLMSMNNYALSTYITIVMVPSTIISVGFFLYFVMNNSINLYLRLTSSVDNFVLLKAAQNHAKRMNRGRLFKSWMSLNWPLIPLYLVGAIGGSVGFGFISKDPAIIATAGVVSGLILISFYLPFYLCNMEALFENMLPSYRNAIDYVTKMAKQAAEDNARKAREEEEYFQRIVENMEKEMQKNKEEKKNDNEDEKE